MNPVAALAPTLSAGPLLAVAAPSGPTRPVELAMHAPDGFLSLPIAAVLWGVTILAVGIAVRRTNATLDERSIPLMGVMAAFIFAAQLVNFPVAGGTSGHLVGGVLAAVLLGPWTATLVMTAVVAVQALVFSDGGVLAMGANIVNLGLIGTLGGYAIYRTVARMLGGEDRGRLPAAAIASYVALVAGAAALALQLAASGTSPAELVLPAMVGFHAVIGIGEALITTAALGFITATRRDLLALRPDRLPPAGGRS